MRWITQSVWHTRRRKKDRLGNPEEAGWLCVKTDILVLADDFTGALDTGMQFAKCGASTRVITDPDCDFARMQAQVLVIDTETRHQTPERAAQRIAEIVRRASESGIRFFYKKTDSALRGNAGAEIEAMLCASGGSCVHFLPSFPAMGRTVQGGVLYIQGQPVAESVFGKDPFEPITRSEVASILAQQTETPVDVRDGVDAVRLWDGIIVYNAQTDAQINEIVNRLRLDGEKVLLAGCAGLAASLAGRVYGGKNAFELPQTAPGMLVVCGSVNEVTRRQLGAARAAGFEYCRLNNCQKLTDFLQTPEGTAWLDRLYLTVRTEKNCIIDTNDAEDEETAADYGARLGMNVGQVGNAIADTLGFVVEELLARGTDRLLLLTGGDVLYHTMNRMGITELTPLAEVSPGVILTCFCCGEKTQYVLTKSGGFGDEQLLIRVNRMFAGQQDLTHAERR